MYFLPFMLKHIEVNAPAQKALMASLLHLN